MLPFVPFCYHLLFVAGRASATPGQQALGLVVRRNDDLGRPTPVQAVGLHAAVLPHAGDHRPAAAVRAVHRPPPHAARPGQRPRRGAGEGVDRAASAPGTCKADRPTHDLQTAAPAAVLLHDGPPALPLSGGTDRAQGRHRDHRPRRGRAARPAVARRLPPQPQHRLRAGVPVLPGLHPDPHSGRHVPARPHAAKDLARQRAAGGLRGAGARHGRAVPVVPALPGRRATATATWRP